MRTIKGPDFLSLVKITISYNEVIIRLNEKGVIKEVFLKEEAPLSWTSYNYYKKRILNAKVGDLFILPKGKSLRELAPPAKPVKGSLTRAELFSGRPAYPSTNKFENYETFLNWYSVLPYSRLFLSRHPDLGFFGIIRFSTISDITIPYHAMPLVIMNFEGIIHGVNGAFIQLFAGQNRQSPDFIGQQAENFMHPVPCRAMIGTPDEFKGLLTEKWKDTVHIKSPEQAWQRVADEKEKNILPLGKPVDTTSRDIRISARFMTESGEAPNFIINGIKDYASFFPDYIGYLIGSQYEKKAVQLKKEGIVIHRIPLQSSLGRDYHTIDCIMQGNLMAYFLDNVLVLGYKDPAPMVSRESYQYLYCRPGKRVRLSQVSISTAPRLTNLNQGFNEVTFLTDKENTHEFQTVLYERLDIDGKLFYAFIFHDISFLKKNIALLHRARENVARDRDKYKALALGNEPDQGIFIGDNPDILKIKKNAKTAAQSNATVLIEGPTGTGKEVLAQYIHANSPFSKGPFVKVDCSTLAGSLLESELFGVEKGAFTGAVESRAGKLEAARDGTLFLDELANLNAGTQAKLLNFLQEFTLERLGSTKKISVNTRVIAATNIPLKALIDQGRFRADLYFRLSTILFTLPPLRERRDDITRLCTFFLKTYNEKFERAVKGFSAKGFQKLMAHDWPGNVRELENVVQKAVLYCEKDVIEEDQLNLAQAMPIESQKQEKIKIPKGDSRGFTRDHIIELLRQNNYILKRAARAGRISRSTLYRKIKKYGIDIKVL
jgi:transcriptional regulator with PAS, ATPase and Fis domain